MKTKTKLIPFLALFLSLATALVASDSKLIRFGVSPGPYGDLITKAIKPSLEKKGYKVELVTFQDWVQPNLALNNGETEANLFQHGLYLAKFSKDHNLQLSPVVLIPTAGLGIYSEKVKSLDQLKKGDEVTLPLDPTNLARALRFLQKAGLVKLKPEIDPTKVTDHDIAENPRGLKFIPTEAAQIPRTLGSATLAVASGNYAIAAGLKLSDALVLEELDDTIKITLAVRTADLDKQWVKDAKEAIESEAFRDAVENPAYIFSSFQKPDWYKAKWSKPVGR
jgi:D-methionine transport system substrate-binding protein